MIYSIVYEPTRAMCVIHLLKLVVSHGALSPIEPSLRLGGSNGWVVLSTRNLESISKLWILQVGEIIVVRIVE